MSSKFVRSLSLSRWNHRRSHSSNRRGSTLLIVMVLMGMLSLLGVLFYTFSAQERSNAEYYSSSHKNFDDPGLSVDALMDHALEQIIVRTRPSLKNSALWGSRHSMLSNMLGTGNHQPGGAHPYTGEGINLIWDPTAAAAMSPKYLIRVDQNRDGSITAADDQTLLNVNFSPAANNLTEDSRLADGSLPSTGVGYSYPDINNLFLSYVAKVRDDAGGVHLVVIPSYVRPQLFRDETTGVPLIDWYKNSVTANRSLRIHPDHIFVSAGLPPAIPAKRLITDAGQATTIIGPSGLPFPGGATDPAAPMDPTYDTNTGGAGAITTQGRMGVWSHLDTTGTDKTRVEFDIDLDGDGVREAAWMDLDHPPLENASGEMFIPLYAVTIVDLDSLVNLNAHGNIARILQESITNVASAPGSPFGSENGSSDTPGRFNFIHASDLGLGPAEVNPIWALRARPTIENDTTFYSFTEHVPFFGTAPILSPSGSLPWAESANMELLWLKAGRIKFSGVSVDDTYPGEYGDEHLLNTFATSRANPGGPWLPRPGLSRDQATGNYQNDGDDSFRGENPPRPFVHPLDFAGLGSYLMPLSGTATDAKKLRFVTAGKAKFPQYDRYSSTTGLVKWSTSSAGTLMSNSRGFGMMDDPYEVALYAEDSRHYDDPFKAEEQMYLSLNNSRLNSLKVSSRLEQLAPFNFAKDSRINSQAETIRRRFSVLSNDRKNFGVQVETNKARPRYWEANPTHDPANGITAPPFPWTSTPANKRRFPPQFGSLVDPPGATVIPRYSPTDPFRVAVRALLEIQTDSTSTNRLQRKLSLNQLLTIQGNQLVFRSLTPHPIDPGAADLAASYSLSDPSDQAKEYLARLDRQQLCRDIYVLLYLLGHGDDAKNTATTDGSTLYSTPQLAEMAQFAVNIVDNMDPDPVMTRFEYDTDLSNGWNLDDNPYTSPTSPTPSTETDRAEVYGVERLDMTISEAMAIHTDAVTGGDHPATSYDDRNAHNFAYVELRNISPFDVVCDNTSEAWQVRVSQEDGSMNPLWERRLSLRNATIAPNSLYTIGSPDFDTSSLANPERSIFKVDPSWVSGTPNFTLGSTWIAPWGVKCDLDLIDATSGDFRIEDGAGTGLTGKGDWLAPLSVSGVGSASAELKIKLYRRAHPTRARCSVADNPWIFADEMTLDNFSTTSFGLPSSTATAAMIQDELDDLISKQRKQPLKNTEDNWSAVGNQRNSLTAENTNSPATFGERWQIHLDRDYSSIGELLNVLLIKPEDVCKNLDDAYTETPKEQQNGTVRLAAAKVLLPAHPTDQTKDNRWHRLFEFVEVHSLYNKNLGLGSELSIVRMPGRVNLNMIRHPEVFAALIDDYRMMNMVVNNDPKDANDPAGSLTDRTGDTNDLMYRDWWQQFLQARDGSDPYWYQSQSIKISLPGLPGSTDSKFTILGEPIPIGSPFRSFTYTGMRKVGMTARPSVDDTLFRSLPFDVARPTTALPSVVPESPRSLLEVGNEDDHKDGLIDPLVRNRLLGKIAGNSTTRSHSYAMFIAVKYFQAGEDTTANNAIRIGGPLNGKAEPEHRGFFVVDRSKLEKAAGVGGYDFTDPNLFRAFVDYRRIIQTQ